MRTPIAVLGATGTVGQKMIALLESHPKFYVAEVAASPGSKGKLYADRVHWREHTDLPENIAKLELKTYEDITSPYVLSAIPSDDAKTVETYLAEKGINVISNTSTNRMRADVPLVIPEINASHLSLIEAQPTKGKIVTNSNCSTMFLCMALAPLMELGEFDHVSVMTMQAISGAGYPGVPSSDVLGNIIPHIGGEEEKIMTEPLKILGKADKAAEFPLTVHVHRVPVHHGHTLAIHVTYKKDVDTNAVYNVFNKWNESHPGMFQVHTAVDRPQPLRDIKSDDQRCHIGRVKQGSKPNVIGLLAAGHNLVRGAAGAALLNLETLDNYLNR